MAEPNLTSVQGPDQWYSDEALRKQAELASLPEGAVPPLSLLAGIEQPRTLPGPDQRCACCDCDARDGAGGSARQDGRRYCWLCIGRGHDESEEQR